MSLLTADDARSMAIQHKSSHEVVFSHIRKMCDNKIINATKAQKFQPHKDYITFTVPTFIFGLPIYDPQSMYMRLYHSLTLRKFEVYSTANPLELYITWRKPLFVEKNRDRDNDKPKSFQKMANLRKQLSKKS